MYICSSTMKCESVRSQGCVTPCSPEIHGGGSQEEQISYSKALFSYACVGAAVVVRSRALS